MAELILETMKYFGWLAFATIVFPSIFFYFAGRAWKKGRGISALIQVNQFKADFQDVPSDSDTGLNIPGLIEGVKAAESVDEGKCL